ncbi:hypothetical protein Dimus_006594 [Dionaea muscipula]
MAEEQAATAASPPGSPPLKKPTERLAYRFITLVMIPLIIIAIIITILILTVFKLKEPIVTLNHIFLAGAIGSGANVSLIMDVSVKNPNPESFMFSHTNTNVYYRGVMVGQGHGPPSKAEGKRTLRMNVTMAVMTERLLGVPELGHDLISRLLTLESYTNVPGRVWLVGIFWKHIVLRINCTVGINISSQAIHDQDCKSHIY